MSKKKKTNPGGYVYSTNPDFHFEKEETTQNSLPPASQELTLGRQSKGRGGKVVTIVTGFVGSEDELKELGKLIKNKCGTGGSIKDGEIIIQGDKRQQIAGILQKGGYHTKISGG